MKTKKMVSLVLLLLFAVMAPSSRSQAQDPATPEGDERVLLPIVALPSLIVNPWPADSAQRQSLNVYLTWQLTDPKWAGATFSVLLEPDDASPDVLLTSGLTKASFDPYTFAEDTVYYWQVVAQNAGGEQTKSPIWQFRTDYFPSTPELGSKVFIPEGEFMMGCDPLVSGFTCFSNQLPLHAVWLDAFYMDKFETTNAQYLACVNAGACHWPRRNSLEGRPYFGESQYDLYPVLYVSHWDAEDYCRWAGKRLPSEAEWEKAARGSIDNRPWPWGNEDWDCTNMNRCRSSADWFTVPVDDMHRGQSPYGVLNMAGNAGEWVQDYFGEDYYKRSPYPNPLNTDAPDGTPHFTIRGGGFHDNWWYGRTSHRQHGHWGDRVGEDAPLFRSVRSGIRCAKSAL